MKDAAHIIAPGAIQSSLEDLWNAKENKNKMRASLFNLIFFTRKSPREEYIRKIAYKILEKFPARIFFISSEIDSKSPIQTAVSVISTKQGEFDITCDLIEISASVEDEQKIPFLILPHIIPDLPVFLVWAEDPTRHFQLYETLKLFATRVIFDSETTEDLGCFARSILQKQTHEFFEIADLNWARIESWRSLISAVFATKEIVEKVKKTSHLKIIYNGQESAFFCHTKIQSIYLQGWIASCLEWKKIEASPSLLDFSYRSLEGKIQVELEEVKNTKLPPGMILSLELKTQDGEVFIFKREEQDVNQISFARSSLTECSLLTHKEVSKGESGQSLVKEICHRGTSSHYLKTLTTIADEAVHDTLF